MNILQVNTSARRDGYSTRLADSLVQRLLARQPGAALVRRDLASQPQPMLDEAALAALFTPAEQRSPEQTARVAQDDALIAEIQAADVLVLGVPMYNFGPSAQLKNWVDAIARAKVTFQYTENGPEGLLKNKKVYVTLAFGGMHRDSERDSITPFLRTILGFLGMSDVHFIYAQGLALGDAAAEQAMAQATAELAALVP